MSKAVSIIQRRDGLAFPNLEEAWSYRELLGTLIWRDIAVRYKQTALGAAWAVVQPVTTMIVLTLFFGKLAGLDQRLDSALPYCLFAYAGLLPWQLFAVALNTASRSVVTSRHLVTKVYFPRILLPMAPVLGGLLDFSISFVLLLGMCWYFGVSVSATILAAPLAVLLAIMAALAAGIWTSAANAVYRDVEYTMPLLVQLWMFLTPLAYPTSIVPKQYIWLYGLNPMAGALEGFRWACFGGHAPLGLMVASFVVSGMFLVGGMIVFAKAERLFADVT